MAAATMTRLPVPGSDDGNWGNILNDFLGQSHNADGSLKSSKVISAGAEMFANKNQPSGYAGLDTDSKLFSRAMRAGISQQAPIVYAPCDLLATVNDLNTFGYYNYSNGTSGVGATITGPGNGHLVASGTPVSLNQRIAVQASNLYGSVVDSGIYTVTATGDASSTFVLTRATDANTSATLGAFFAVQIIADGSTVFFLPAATPFVVGTTAISVAVAVMQAHAEAGSTASGQYAHAEAESTASGFRAHAESGAIASGDSSHAEGSGRADGATAHAESNAAAIGSAAHAENNGTANGDNSHAEGYATANADLSHAEGVSSSYAVGLHTEGSGQGGIRSQFSRATRSAYAFDGSTFQMVDFNNNPGLLFTDFRRTALVRVRVVGRRVDTVGTASAWTAQCIIDGDGTSSYRFVGSPAFTLVAQDAGASTWSVSDLAFDGGDAHRLILQVTGDPSMRVEWSATIELDEVGN